MADATDKLRCTLGCWTMGLLAGTLATVMLLLLGAFSWPGAIFSGGIAFVIVGVLLSVSLCKPLPTLAEVQARHAKGQASHARSQAAAPAPVATAPVPFATAPVLVAAAPVLVAAAPVPVATAPVPVAAAPVPVAAAPVPVATAPVPVAAAPVPVAAAPAPVTAAPAPVAAAPAPVAAAPVPAPTLELAAAADLPPVAPDGKPPLLTEARSGGPDDLRQIRGVGLKLEEMLHRKGVYHFDQVASWRAPEVAWMDDNLEGFKGRVSRDGWVAQARLLAGGGETAFSRKVEGGDVY